MHIDTYIYIDNLQACREAEEQGHVSPETVEPTFVTLIENEKIYNIMYEQISQALSTVFFISKI